MGKCIHGGKLQQYAENSNLEKFSECPLNEISGTGYAFDQLKHEDFPSQFYV